MRFLFLVSIVIFVGACAHKPHHHHHNHEGGHDHAKVEQDKNCGGCAHHDKAHKGENCNSCGTKDGCSASCEGEKKERGCCSDNKTCSTKDAKNGEVCTAEATTLENSPKILKNISQEEFSKVYTANKEKIGQSCSNPAMTYCGKTTKDLNVTQNELTCLWTKVFRVTRETLPELDGTPCSKMIKGFAKK
jgi:hypothetical protein